jgi:hypothetical protein
MCTVPKIILGVVLFRLGQLSSGRYHDLKGVRSHFIWLESAEVLTKPDLNDHVKQMNKWASRVQMVC